MSRNVFWDRYWGHVSQLSAKFFSIPSNSPRCLCGQCTSIMGILSCSVCDGVTKLGVAFLSLTGVEYLVALYLNQNLSSTAGKT